MIEMVEFLQLVTAYGLGAGTIILYSIRQKKKQMDEVKSMFDDLEVDIDE